MTHIVMKRNGRLVQTDGYILNFANKQYKMTKIKFIQELKCDTGNKSVSLTLSK